MTFCFRYYQIPAFCNSLGSLFIKEYLLTVITDVIAFSSFICTGCFIPFNVSHCMILRFCRQDQICLCYFLFPFLIKEILVTAGAIIVGFLSSMYTVWLFFTVIFQCMDTVCRNCYGFS